MPPVVVLITVVVGGGGSNAPLKCAVTDLASSAVTVQPPVPEHAPPQPSKVNPAVGVAVSVTTVPRGKVVEQLDGQSIAYGALRTNPAPSGLTVTERATFAVPWVGAFLLGGRVRADVVVADLGDRDAEDLLAAELRTR